jgi:hypothetical protein
MPLAHRILMSAALAEVDAKGNAQIRAAMSDLLIMGSPGLKMAALNRNIDLILEPPRRQGGGCTNATGAMSVRGPLRRNEVTRACPLSGVDRERLVYGQDDANDPKRSLSRRAEQ